MKIERSATWGPVFNRASFFFADYVRNLVLAMPEGGARAFGRWMGRRMRGLMAGRTRMAAEQAERALGPGGGAAADRAFENFGEFLIEVLRIPRTYSPERWRERVEVEGLDRLQRAAAAGRGVVAVGAHLGNWEVGACALGYLGFRLTWLLRPLENPLIQAALNDVRALAGQHVITKWGGLKEGLHVLRRGEVLVMLVDQDAREQGVFVPFFGRAASTLKSPALLSQRTGAPIVPFVARRAGGGRFVLHVDEPVTVEGEGEEAIRAATARFTAALEAQIRLAPEQWLWVHKRWKTRPAAENP